jgi:hypothetical protein
LTLRYQRLSLLLIAGVLACSAVSCESVTRPDQESSPKQETEYLFNSLTFEIAAIQSCRPARATLDTVRRELARYKICAKKDIVFRVRDARLPPCKAPDTWFYGDLLIFHNLYGSLPPQITDDGRHYIFVAFLRGAYAGHRMQFLAGIQLYSRYFVVFKDGANGIESSTFMHEFFHSLGLRESSEQPPAHCPNDGCLMFPRLGGRNNLVLCDECSAELRDLIRDLRHERARKKKKLF